jgi:hypothetical protein
VPLCGSTVLHVVPLPTNSVPSPAVMASPTRAHTPPMERAMAVQHSDTRPQKLKPSAEVRACSVARQAGEVSRAIVREASPSCSAVLLPRQPPLRLPGQQVPSHDQAGQLSLAHGSAHTSPVLQPHRSTPGRQPLTSQPGVVRGMSARAWRCRKRRSLGVLVRRSHTSCRGGRGRATAVGRCGT